MRVPRDQILEVGCGAGLTTAPLSQRGYAVVAADIVLDMLLAGRLPSVGTGRQRFVSSLSWFSHPLGCREHQLHCIHVLGLQFARWDAHIRDLF